MQTTPYLSQTVLHQPQGQPSGSYVELLGETYYRISHYDQMPPFFMSLVSSGDHWLFIASTGGLTAGRTNADNALFPYETEDKLTAHYDHTGGKTVIRVEQHGRVHLWEPFSSRYAHLYQTERHLYKNIYGNKLVFEEINHNLNLTLRVAWRTSDRFGFVRSCWLSNTAEDVRKLTVLDGLQGILPYGATAVLQNSMSNLLDAYKQNELDPATELGIYALSATLSDQAEPSESLRATVAWQVGLPTSTGNPLVHLLSRAQLTAFRLGQAIEPETATQGQAGAYLVQSVFELAGGATQHWHIVADVNQDSTAVVNQQCFLSQPAAHIEQALETDIDDSTALLRRYIAAADGLQQTNDHLTTSHHLANVMFNIMRGGLFVNGYHAPKSDLLSFVRTRQSRLLTTHADWFAQLPDPLDLRDLLAQANTAVSPDLTRLCYEYLPLTFSRRHGDPSRPWNQFAINLKHPDGSPRLDYQGNWRDIFQNWEPLALSFPAYLPSMIAKFLNATTADGYNPYRVTRDGIEWEVPEPENPWSNIGYWSDHQIIYLQKLLELAEQIYPGTLAAWDDRPLFSYANVPYRLRPYSDMREDWANTLDFDWTAEKEIVTAVDEIGTDGRLCRTADNDIIHVTLTEKLLVLLLAKLVNLVPEGGIWMNTQRPEWNDANNALVGKGLSVVTAAYLHRFIAFWQQNLPPDACTVNTAVADLFTAVNRVLETYHPTLATGFNSHSRRAFMDELGTAVSAYRAILYQDGVPTTTTSLPTEALSNLLGLAQAYTAQTVRANKRPDNLYHSYNILRYEQSEAGEGTAVDHLYLMLEGQVAVLSAGLLTPQEASDLLHSLRHSDLYRADQHTYMLYPNRQLPRFSQKNNVPAAKVADSALVAALAQAGDVRLLRRDLKGNFHFNGTFRNQRDVVQVLAELAQEESYAPLVTAERERILDLFEETFNHRAFTGRSGTFFAYEGLGSIYWHMVSKLLLAVQECLHTAVAQKADETLITQLSAAYDDVRQGIGFNKSPAVYGAFPTDPYSHTPYGAGARQPGMTGQVKEEILTRLGEFGVHIRGGALHFEPVLLAPDEFLVSGGTFDYIDCHGREQALALPPHSLAFTLCQTPIVYTLSDAPAVTVTYHDGQRRTHAGDTLDATLSQHLFDRDGHITAVWVTLTGR